MRKFRLPTTVGRASMTIAELEKALKLFDRWYMTAEEGMTFREADEELKKRNKFERYIKLRKMFEERDEVTE